MQMKLLLSIIIIADVFITVTVFFCLKEVYFRAQYEWIAGYNAEVDRSEPATVRPGPVESQAWIFEGSKNDVQVENDNKKVSAMKIMEGDVVSIRQPEKFVSVSHINSTVLELLIRAAGSPRYDKRAPSAEGAYTLPAEQRLAMKNRYLFPLSGFNGGPSYQYEQFKDALQLAVFTNRTIVLPAFKHHRAVLGHGRVSAQNTFDSDRLREFIPTRSIHEFLSECGTNITDVWTLPSRFKGKVLERTYRSQKAWLRKQLQVEVPHQSNIPKTASAKWKRAFEDTAHSPCVIVTNPIKMEAMQVPFPNRDKISVAIDGHLARVPFLRKAVDDVIPRLCDGQPFVAMHWRNKTGERCRVNLRGFGHSTLCLDFAKYSHKIKDHIATDVNRIMTRHRLSCLYVALPPREIQEILPLLSERIQRIHHLADVLQLHNPLIELFKDDDYYTSLLEQEICSRSEVFIASGTSNWSAFVMKERLALGNMTTYDLSDLPGISAELLK
ncbi:uncharacterized protein [Ptychodera flava]|uniref:uncharacterized protein n=1 Tax=Ptychodera flava TaxID=63121 RepID=UPI003969E356